MQRQNCLSLAALYIPLAIRDWSQKEMHGTKYMYLARLVMRIKVMLLLTVLTLCPDYR